MIEMYEECYLLIGNLNAKENHNYKLQTLAAACANIHFVSLPQKLALASISFAPSAL